MKKKQDDWRKVIEYIARSSYSYSQAFSDFVLMGACALSAGCREKEYISQIATCQKT